MHHVLYVNIECYSVREKGPTSHKEITDATACLLARDTTPVNTVRRELCESDYASWTEVHHRIISSKSSFQNCMSEDGESGTE